MTPPKNEFSIITLLLSMLIMLFTGCEDFFEDPEDSIGITDQDFITALIEVGVSNNRIITQEEAEAVKHLNIARKVTHQAVWKDEYTEYNFEAIYSIEGIEYFINLEYLNCQNHWLQELNTSNNSQLLTLICGFNDRLDSLNVSKNSDLTTLNCEWNQLANLDVSNNTSLIYLDCSNNQLSSLDVSNNTYLRDLYCGNDFLGDNSITELDLSRNNQLEHLSITRMPSLTKVCVWTMPFPPEGVVVDTTGSSNVYFTTDCNN